MKMRKQEESKPLDHIEVHLFGESETFVFRQWVTFVDSFPKLESEDTAKDRNIVL